HLYQWNGAGIQQPRFDLPWLKNHNGYFDYNNLFKAVSLKGDKTEISAFSAYLKDLFLPQNRFVSQDLIVAPVHVRPSVEQADEDPHEDEDHTPSSPQLRACLCHYTTEEIRSLPNAAYNVL